jgi:hypothetical protein
MKTIQTLLTFFVLISSTFAFAEGEDWRHQNGPDLVEENHERWKAV